MSLVLTDYAGHRVDVEPEAVQPELDALLDAVDRSCGESGTEPHQENLRRARAALKKVVSSV